MSEGPADGVYWLPALDPDPDDWHEGLRMRVKQLAETMRDLPPETFLISATRLGGRHGYDAAGAQSVDGRRGDRPHEGAQLASGQARLIKAVDFPASRKTAALADALVEETLRDPGAVEIGHAEACAGPSGSPSSRPATTPRASSSADDVFLITGAAGSIVSAIAADLAAASRGTFHLLDLVPAPDPADPDLARFAADRDGLKRELADHLRAAGEKPTPKLVERELARIERGRAALDAIEAIEAAGGTAHWHQADLTDGDQVAAAVNAALDAERAHRRARSTPAASRSATSCPTSRSRSSTSSSTSRPTAGTTSSRRSASRRPRAAVVFSSIAGRFGNAGQTDYSAANDLLCKAISKLRAEGVHGVAIDWTAWAQIGMASRGSIPKVMETAGIDMLPPEHGIPVVRRELTAPAGGEVLVAGALGVLTEERHASGGLALEGDRRPAADDRTRRRA